MTWQRVAVGRKSIERNKIVEGRPGSGASALIYYSAHLTSKATTNVISSTVYLMNLVVCVSDNGTAMSVTVQNKESPPKKVYFVQISTLGVSQPFTPEVPILMTDGIDIVIGGTTAGVVDIFMTYQI